MANFVLVHGMTCGSWCWNPVAQRLRAAGHTVFSPTLSGLAERSHLLGPHINLDTHIQDVVGLMQWEDLADFVLCGHSYGGMVITGAADRAPERIKALVYLDAFLPENGQCSLDIAKPGRAEQIRKLASEKGDGWRLPPLPATAYGPIADKGLIAYIEGKCTPMPLAALEQPIRLHGAWRSVARKLYILAEGYEGSAFQDTARRLRAEKGWTVTGLPGSHFLGLLFPEETARLLIEAAA